LIDRGCVRSSNVGIAAERSVDLVIGIMGILKAGCAFVPLDPTYPAERLRFMIADAGALLILTDASAERLFDSVAVDRVNIASCFDASPRFSERISLPPLPGADSGDQLAYIMYTSGSTGTPKGVCVPHAAVVRLVKGTRYAVFTRDDI